MKYPNLFKNRYPSLRGRDWIKSVDPEDRQAFIQLGLSETDFGKSGGQAIVKRRGKEYMQRIGRIGAIVTNTRKAWKQAVELETNRIAQEAQRQNN